MSYGRVVKLLIVHYMYCYFFEKSLMSIEGILLKYNDTRTNMMNMTSMTVCEGQ